MKQNRQNRFISFVGVAAAFALSVHAASGQNIVINQASSFGGFSATGKFNLSADANRAASVFTMNNTTNGGTFQAFCAQPLTDIEAVGVNRTYAVEPLANLTNSTLVARLVAQYLASSKTALEVAGAQWAIWEVMTEANPPSGGYSLDFGNTFIYNSVSFDPQGSRVKANQYLANINNFAPATITYITNASFQNLVAISPIPEPSSLGLLAFSGLFLLRRKR